MVSEPVAAKSDPGSTRFHLPRETRARSVSAIARNLNDGCSLKKRVKRPNRTMPIIPRKRPWHEIFDDGSL